MEQPAPQKEDLQHRAVFVIALRILGAYVLTQSLYNIVTCINVMTDHYKPAYTSSGAYALHAVVDIMAGLYLLRGAPRLVEFAYRPKPPKVSDLPADKTSDQP